MKICFFAASNSIHSHQWINFFVNKGDAKFDDMKKLIEFVSKSVLKKTGIKLETEIKILE